MQDASALLETTLRRERGPLLGALLRLCGSMDAAEEALQEASLSALRAWREELPANPGAWLQRAAKNSARDAWRRRTVVSAKAPLLAQEELGPEEPGIDALCDDHLRLLFACCHPALSVDKQIALTLRAVAGFSTEELARAFLCTEATISQRILRAKQALEQSGASFEGPEREQRSERVEAVLGVVYALYNEGHTSREGPWMRVELQAEALRLARLLGELLPREPEVFGLLALVAFGAARARARVDAQGEAILLDAQDRSLWDRELLREGLHALRRARSLGGDGPYALEARIAAEHATAPSWERTNWRALVAAYDALVALAPSPVAKLNRAVALAMERGPAAGLAALKELEAPLARYHLFYATRAELRARAGRDPRRDLERALELATNEAEQRLLRRRLARALSG